MYVYELTERGKIVLAVLLVLLLLLVPSAILLCTAIASQPPAEDSGFETSEGTPPTQASKPPLVITQSPPQNGGGFSPPDVSSPDSGATTSPDASPPDSGATTPPDVSPPDSGATTPPDVSPPGSGGNIKEPETSKPPKFGPTGGNPSKGTLSFLYSPHFQNAIDSKTSSMLDKFISSSKKNNSILIEMPTLSGEDAENVIIAVTSAFTSRGISEQRLEFIDKKAEVVDGAFEIHLSFIPYGGK